MRWSSEQKEENRKNEKQQRKIVEKKNFSLHEKERGNGISIWEFLLLQGIILPCSANPGQAFSNFLL